MNNDKDKHDFYDLLQDNIDDLLTEDTNRKTDEEMLDYIYATYPKKEDPFQNIRYFFHSFINNRPLTVAIAVVIISICVLPLLLLPGLRDAQAGYTVSVQRMHGEVVVKRDDNIIVSDSLMEHDRISTNTDSHCTIALNNTSRVILTNNTELELVEYKKNKIIKVYLHKGNAYFSINEDDGGETSRDRIKDFIVETGNALVRVTGTIFMVSIEPDGDTLTAVEKGIVEVRYKPDGKRLDNNALPITVGNYARIHAKGKKRFINDSQIKERLETVRNFYSTKKIEAGPSQTPGPQDSDKKPEPTQSETSDSNGEKRAREQARVENVDADIDKKKPEAIKLRYKSDRIFKVSEEIDKDQKILSLTPYNELLVVQTKSVLACIENTGKRVWEFENVNDLYFISRPYIYQDRLYISTMNNNLLCLDMVSGEEIALIKAHGNIPFSYSMAAYEGILYLPFQTGLFTFDPKAMKLSNKPFISFNNPVTPVFTNNRFLLSSYLENRCAFFDEKGNLLEEFQYQDRTFNVPELSDHSMYIGCHGGTIYHLTPENKMNMLFQSDNAIITRISKYKNNLYYLVDTGELISFDLIDLKALSVIMAETAPDMEEYVFKAPVVIDHKLFVGNNNGELYIIDPIHNKLVKKMVLGQNALTTSVVKGTESYLIGTAAGEVYSIY